ncbi:ABC transporter permease [Duncaniella muricolitica]|jgi:ABC-2 type transport system permease protein|uniref:ABC transporter permease n=1 Tax=Duncaniella muricolitica TaxID=2880704 RepID=UPI00244E46D9|nr:ABC transporter permease [Duncaniella muricolitica]
MKWFKSLFRVWRRETWLVFTDIGVMLFFFGLPLAYPIVYTLIYNPEVVTEIPTVIVDNSRTAESRDLARTLDATQAIDIKGYAANMAEARRAWAEKECYGIIEIPADYAKRLGQGGSATISFYNDMSLLIRYRQYLFALTGVQMHEVSEITAERVATRGGILATRVTGLPVDTASECLGDPTQGFASFIMPGIVVLILQQSMLLGITMIAGTAADRRRRNRGRDPYAYDASPLAVVLGKSLCYLMLYIPVSYYILHIVPEMFALPHVGDVVDYMPFVFAMLVATTFLGQTLQVFVRERETSLLVIVYTSVVFLFLSGLTWPRYAFNKFWLMVSDLIPATWGVEGFIRINSNAATISDVSRYYWSLWALTALYFLLALALRAYVSRRPDQQSVPVAHNN